MERPKDQGSQQKPQLRGLYRNVNISVPALNVIIIACVAVILLVVVLELQNPGLTVRFDSRGGTDVPPQEQFYGQLLEVPEPPTREGYVFTGWYKESTCYEPWDDSFDTIESDMTLYAGWEKTE